MKNKTKKLLIITYTPTHPLYSGNRRRTYNLLNNFRKLGYEIHFLYESREICPRISQKPDIKAMKKEWDRFYYVPLSMYGIKRYIDRQIGKIGILLKKIAPGLFKILKKTEANIKGGKPLNIDTLYNPKLEYFIKKTLSQTSFDIVISNKVFPSKALELFDKDTIKVIDTHDALTTKKAYEVAKYEPRPIFTNQEEAKVLNRADAIIAIQEEEAKFFKSIIEKDKKVVTIGHIQELKPPLKRNSNRKNIFFIGFINEANKLGVNTFIKKSLPTIRQKFPDARLILAGRICDCIPNQPGIIKIGKIKNIEKAYLLADVVISPMFIGTGLKIKNAEALAFSKPVVTTTIGMKGLEKGENKAFLTADTPEQFSEQIKKLFTDKKLYEKISKGANKFMKDYNKKNLQSIKKILKKG
jgi:glycosyltransferase involved in cell wall biosynthesis